ncbi:MAG: septum formation initiator family protein [Prevotellaceae bacterium]|jgi:cell division protein FtsB|nr:septum formation initiator family protein [Prevotellaceae bacterium]
MNTLHRLWLFAGRRKYLITLVLFGLFVGFADENSLVRRFEQRREIDRLHREIDHYQQDFDESTRRLGELDVDSGAIERIAREKYLMKKPNEDIYLFEEDLKK